MNNDYCNVDKLITYICKNDYKYFLKKAYVVGVGLGYKRKGGFYTGEKCIKVFVSRKLPKKYILPTDMIPLTFKNIKTDVVESGIFTPCYLRDRIRPVRCGYSIGPNETTAEGTAGCLVTNGVSKFVLGVSHVLSMMNELPIKYPIVQPAYICGGRIPRDTIARLHKFVPIRFIEGTREPINLTDVGIAKLENPNIVSPEIAFIGKITCVKSPKLNGTVKKVGCVTELTQGTITGINATIEMIINDKNAVFSETTVTTKMGEEGDSGSLVVNNNNCGVGILFGVGEGANAVCRLDTSLAQLDVHLVK